MDIENAISLLSPTLTERNKEIMDTKTAFYIVREYVRKDDYYVPRPYQSIVGIWTVDTWQRDGITLKIMDDGYTDFIEIFGVKVTHYGYSDTIEFAEGTSEDLVQIAEKITAILTCH